MPKEKTEKKKREEYVVKIGPELMELIKRQMEIIEDITYNVTKSSVYLAGEIIAKKAKGDV